MRHSAAQQFLMREIPGNAAAVNAVRCDAASAFDAAQDRKLAWLTGRAA
jgi:hypothetical protein